MKVVFSNRAYAAVLAETTEKIKTETGGLFLGTIQDDIFFIIEAIDPGPKSIFEIAYFEYDKNYTQHLINKIANLYDKKLNLIGLWHRHPGSFDKFSSTDDGTNAKYAAMRKEGAISALVNIDPNFRITMYQVHQPCKYQKISYTVGDEFIPDELLKFKTPDRFFEMMGNLSHSKNPENNFENAYHKSVSLESFMNYILPSIQSEKCSEIETNNLLIDEKTQEKLVEEIIDDITYMAEKGGVETAISLSDSFITVYQETINKTVKLYFAYSVIKNSVVVSYKNDCFLYHKGMFSEAVEKRNAKKHCETTETANSKKQTGVLNSVIKIIKFNRNED